jgi:hypothetical protein
MSDGIVRNRAVFFIGGYDPKTPAEFFGRMAKELRRFEQTWNVSAALSPVDVADDGESATAVIETSADGQWRVNTEFTFLVLDDIVTKDFARPLHVRLVKYIGAFLDFMLSGAFISIALRSWRFALYLLYPFLAICFFAAIAVGAAALAARLPAPYSFVVAPAAGVAVFGLLLGRLGERWSVTHLMDLWSFSRDYLRGRRPDAESLLQGLAETVVARAASKRFDEIILIGHSTGGGLILDVTARALRLDPDLAGRARHVGLLTLGSTALKFGLHPAGGWFRAKVQSLIDEPRLGWMEFQCLIDVINFYKTNPVAEMALKPRSDGRAFPVVQRVHVRDMLEEATYKRIKHNPFRIHYQFVLGNTQRYFYDFFMICCGPTFLPQSGQAGQADPSRTLDAA